MAHPALIHGDHLVLEGRVFASLEEVPRHLKMSCFVFVGQKPRDPPGALLGEAQIAMQDPLHGTPAQAGPDAEVLDSGPGVLVDQAADLGYVLLRAIPWSAPRARVLAFLALVLRPAVLELLEDLEGVAPAHCSGSKGLAQVIVGLRSSLPNQELSADDGALLVHVHRLSFAAASC